MSVYPVEYSRKEKDEEGHDEVVPPFQDLFILLGYAGLLDTLQLDEGPFTLFAPTDDAFHKFLWGEEAVRTVGVVVGGVVVVVVAV